MKEIEQGGMVFFLMSGALEGTQSNQCISSFHEIWNIFFSSKEKIKKCLHQKYYGDILKRVTERYTNLMAFDLSRFG